MAGEDVAEPRAIANADVAKLLGALSPYQYQLAHDGFLQFGLLNDHGDRITEVFVTPTKHFKVWLQDADQFHSIMGVHELPERTTMEFIDEYPRTTTRLPESRGVLDGAILWKSVGDLISGAMRMQ